MIERLGVSPRGSPMAQGPATSIAAYKSLIYAVTTNGVAEDGITVRSPEAPSLVCFDKDTGKVLWEKKLEANPEGLPSVYESGGRQYIVFCTRVGRVFDNIGAESIAWEQGKPEAAGYYVFALPKK